jgi:hypothetical protein
MSQIARVESVDALKEFRVALIKFAETANGALGDCESEVQRMQMWLENDQTSHWTSQIRKLTEVVSRAKEALRMKKVFKDATGSKGSYVDEEKALAKATRALDEAQQKMAATKSWARKFPKEASAFKGSIQRMSTFVLSDVPVAAAKLDRMTAALKAYISFVAPSFDSVSVGPSSSGTNAMPSAGEPPAAAAAPEGEAAQAAATEAAPPTEVAPGEETTNAEPVDAAAAVGSEKAADLTPGQPAAS